MCNMLCSTYALEHVGFEARTLCSMYAVQHVRCAARMLCGLAQLHLLPLISENGNKMLRTLITLHPISYLGKVTQCSYN